MDLRNVDTLPDIYYIILDSYASANTLKEIWDYDNHDFIDYLTGRGFYIASESRSNYIWSHLSLASSLNMEYINYLSGELGGESKSQQTPYQMIKDSKVMRFLKSKGYKFVHLSSGYPLTRSNPYADWDIKCGKVNEFTMVLVRTTILKPLGRYLIAPDRRHSVLCAFSTLAEVQHRIEGPRFIFAHVLVPHPPFLFGPNGEPVDGELQMTMPMRTPEGRYLGQLRFVNKKVQELVEAILSQAETAPIIIIQADHGSRSVPGNLKERTGILNAYYLPDKGKDLLYDSITPVNTFRLIFNGYLNASYDLLEDRMYNSTQGRPYRFTDVTDIIKLGRDTTHVDIRNLTATGFEVRVEEDRVFDGTHADETIAWLALAQAPAGGQIGTVQANHRWKAVTFPQPFSAVPNLQATIITENGPDTAQVDIRELTASGFEVRVEEDSGFDGKHLNNETIAWLALAQAPAGGQMGAVQANHQWKAVVFPQPFSAIPGLQATIITEKGRETAHVDIRELTASGFEVRVEEDSGFDGVHVNETIAWLALAQAPTGAQMGTVQTNHEWKAIVFPQPFSAVPNLQATINTEND